MFYGGIDIITQYDRLHETMKHMEPSVDLSIDLKSET